MTAPFATLDGQLVASARVHVPGRGPWFADVDLLEAPTLPSGRVVLALGELALSGTVDARYAGAFGLQRRVRLVAGAGAWGVALPAKGYHNDAGLRAGTIAGDAAREAGELIGGFAPAAERVGADYVRQAGPASRALEDVIGGVPWWVDYDGTTQVGTRPAAAAAPGTFEVLEHDPRARLVTLATDDLRSVGIGSVLSDARLEGPQTVRELELEVVAEAVRVKAWCGGEAGSRGRLASAVEAIVERILARHLWGTWRYRVVQMSGAPPNRVELQAMSRAAGLPDVIPASMAPGVSGAHARLTPGVEVLVEFVEGDRTRPVVTHFAGAGQGGFVPARLTLGADTTDPSPDAARSGDSVSVTIPALSFLISSGPDTLNPAPVTVNGTITSGSTKVGIGG